ncbi:MAG: branched-chain amino acid ABC transporter permease [Deltaproteobacteria bacterium]|nr:branched-chain amino acid ABC transporter permease [Deltaproteobacteria bacterium]
MDKLWTLLTFATLALPALGLCLAIKVTKYFNLTYGDIITAGAFLTLLCNLTFGFPMVISLIIGMIFTAALGVFLHKTIFKPLMDLKVNPLTLLVVSLGAGFVVRNLILIGWGPQPFQYSIPLARARHIGPLFLTTNQIFIILTCIFVAVGVTSDNPELSEIRGISIERVYVYTWIIACALAAMGGVFMGTLGTIKCGMGIGVLVTLFACLIVGGIDNPYGAVFGALIIAFTMEATAIWISPPYKVMAAYLLMIIILLVKPSGLLGGEKIQWKYFLGFLRSRQS